MTQVSRSILKTYFETGDLPTQAEFINLIDSMLNIVDDSVSAWLKSVISYAAFQPNATDSGFIDAFVVPAGYQISGFFVIPTVAFSGGGITAANIEFYDKDDNNEYLNSSFDLAPAITDILGMYVPAQIPDIYGIIDKTGGAVRVGLNVNSGGSPVIDDLTAGSFDIYYTLIKIPF